MWTSGLLVLGFVFVAVASRVLHWPLDGTLAACATWLVLVLLAVALRNLLAAIAGGRTAVLGPLQRLPQLVTGLLPLVAFIAGLGFGRVFWH
jgi:hypothetical protein